MPLTDVIVPLMKAQGFHSRMVEFGLQQQWRTIVGPHIASHTFPEAIRHRKLFLLAENSVWLQQLLFLKTELLSKIGSAMGKDLVSDIILRVGVIPAVNSALVDVDGQNEVIDHATLGQDQAAYIEDSIRDISNKTLLEGLRALFVKAASMPKISSPVRSEKLF
jgi:hypothetical protein